MFFVLPLLACRANGHAAHAAAGEIVVRSSSTMGYGCVVPPFATSVPDASGSCGSAAEPYFLTTSTASHDPAAGPPGEYRLVGRWAEDRSSWSAWARARGEVTSEGAPPESLAYRVLDVRDWCVEWRSIPKAYREPSSLAPASAPWRSRICDE